jgi:hypothetical protein
MVDLAGIEGEGTDLHQGLMGSGFGVGDRGEREVSGS